MSDRPRLLDLFCGAGGAARGYQLAGFHVTGVDSKPQPRYAGDDFVRADALAYVAAHGREFDVIHASPPCQQYTALRRLTKREYPDLIAPTRRALEATGRPWVIENVPGAPLVAPAMLCGTMFGLRVYRHRLFESPVVFFTPGHGRHRVPTIQRGYARDWPGFVTVAGGLDVPVALAARAMGIDWMTRAELSQAIPPAYCEWLGRQLRRALERRPALPGLAAPGGDSPVYPHED